MDNVDNVRRGYQERSVKFQDPTGKMLILENLTSEISNYVLSEVILFVHYTEVLADFNSFCTLEWARKIIQYHFQF